MRRLLASRRFWTVLITLSTTLGVAAQEARRKGGRPLRNQGGEPLKKVQPQGGDPLARADAGKAGAPGTYHYTFKLRSFDGTPLAASYYPAKVGVNAPVVILIHERQRSRKDFEDPVLEFKGRGLAEHLQDESYAVFTMDLRGQGQNPRRALAADERDAMADDLQAAYQFLLDRHNRGELNVGKLGVVGVGEGGNLAAAWAHQPGAAVSTEGRAGDLAALVLVSPQPEGSGYALTRIAPPVALRVPLFLMAGAKDAASKDAVEAVRKDLERGRFNKVEIFPSPLHGYKLLRLEPGAAEALVKYLEAHIKLRANEWEPRYNQIPVAFTDVQTVRRQAGDRKAGEKKAQPDAKAKPAEKAKADEKKAPADPKSEKSE
ncbi:alpha/beta hydrolase [Paludisphaera mucosa]|uniref:Alpha/beta fold hydrolase n=1 Tax=Paludisphaera mucosa TaxID=3030827 RepID=A0ABT6FJZ5_9BACT|nr:alpha/beta fold hydrolase [Paludisphaera mucosa]MDG3007678.1 alpha/beta fold hydrolase [Paludisphaera mucosa]